MITRISITPNNNASVVSGPSSGPDVLLKTAAWCLVIGDSPGGVRAGDTHTPVVI